MRTVVLLLLVASRASAPAQVRLAGRFSLFDGATDARLTRGQALFDDRASASGRRCASCHNAPDDGSNVSGIRFDVRTGGRRPVPSLRGARAPRAFVRQHELALGFAFSADEEHDLVAFLDAI